jgi:osmoprotectant transport system permease protein
LGQLFTEGFQSHYLAPIVVGIVLIGLLALAVDVLLVGLRELATPWVAS